MAVGQIGENFRHHLEQDEKAVQRILVELVGTPEEIIEESVLAFDVTLQQGLGQGALVAEVIEEAALGDADGGDELVDRSRGETLLEHAGLRRVEDAFGRIRGLSLD
jgi:hypothetical protein